MMESVEAGSASFPVTTSPAAVTAAQRGREEAQAAGAWTIGATEMQPTRMSIHFQFASEDALRVPGLEDALTRDMRMALRERMDATVFNGDDGANENVADIIGLFGIAGLTEKSVHAGGQASRPRDACKAFSDLIDGLHAESLGDVRVVTSVGATRLWLQTIINSAAENQTMAQFLRASGLMWKSRVRHRHCNTACR